MATVGDTSNRRNRTGGVVGYSAYSATVEYCYAMGGVISGNSYTGGVAGGFYSNYDGTVRYCAALVSSMTTGYYYGRVLGENKGTMNNNYAYNNMTVNDSTVTSGLGTGTI